MDKGDLSRDFRRVEVCGVEREMSLSGEEAANLVKMTPNYWHTPPEVWTRLQAMQGIQVRASFRVLAFRR